MTPLDEGAAHAPAGPDSDEQLRRLRLMQWTLRGALGLALAVSMAANVLHAAPDPVARSIAAWSPLALYTAIEVMTRVPIRNRLLGGIRIVATVAIAVIAGITSYLHMVGVAERYGESWQVVYLLPISVDGLVAVLTLSLLDIAAQVRTISAATRINTQRHIGRTDTSRPALPVDVASLVHAAGDLGTSASKISTPALPKRPARSRRHDGPMRGDRPLPVDAGLATTPSHSNSSALPAELLPLLESATDAYQQLRAAGKPVTRDAFAAALRDRGQPLRSAKITPLLAAVRERVH
jgi:hypothetical protein